MLQLVALTLFALLLARVLRRAAAGLRRDPRARRALAAAASQLLPAGHALRIDVGAVGAARWAGSLLVLAPVAAYALRDLRCAGAPGPTRDRAAPHPRAWCSSPTTRPSPPTPRAALGRGRRGRGRRAAPSRSAGAARTGRWTGTCGCALDGELAEIEMLRVAPGHAARASAAALLAAAEGEARARGARG